MAEPSPTTHRIPSRQSRFWRLYGTVASAVDHRFRWFRIGLPLGIADLIGIRTKLRSENLYDTSEQPNPVHEAPPPKGPTNQRSSDGSWNNLDHPTTGMAGTRFGRNVPIRYTWPNKDLMLTPSPRLISRRLMTRHELRPAEGGNALIASWLQFMIRDWFRHGTSPVENPWTIPLDNDDDWPEPPLLIHRTPPDPTSTPNSHVPPTYINAMTHWWDGSQVYGNGTDEQTFLRSHEGGKLRLIDGLPPLPDDPARNPTRTPGFWLGIGMLQTLFAMEHNSICDMLQRAHPGFDDELLFQRARLITAALMAKIHTTEWTPAVTGHPTSAKALQINWYGFAGRKFSQLLRHVTNNEVLTGIPGSPVNDSGVPFALTEEFVAVYRMHPLIPDHFNFRRATDNRPTLGDLEFDQLTGPAAVDIMRENSLTDLIYTFGTMNPGVVTLHNFPKHLQNFRRPDNGKLMDLAATDILRCRELGVPRYTEFRRLLHLTVPRTFEEITSDDTWAAELREVYDNDIDLVDLIPGMYAEDLIPGFAFSDTAFRIFILMASRRLNSDRFFTTDFSARVYTAEGMRWIADNTMISILGRHCPDLRPTLGKVGNAFALWPASTTESSS